MNQEFSAENKPRANTSPKSGHDWINVLCRSLPAKWKGFAPRPLLPRTSPQCFRFSQRASICSWFGRCAPEGQPDNSPGQRAPRPSPWETIGLSFQDANNERDHSNAERPNDRRQEQRTAGHAFRCLCDSRAHRLPAPASNRVQTRSQATVCRSASSACQ